MGLGIIGAVMDAAGGVLADQYKEFFVCPEMSENELVVKGLNQSGSRGNNHGSENIISNGSAIMVSEGQAMIIVDQGAIAEYCDKPGIFQWNASSEPSIFTDGIGEGLKKSWDRFKKRVTFGGGTGSDQRVYFFNLKNIIGNKYGTATPIIFHIVDPVTKLELDVRLRCNGEYSYHIVDPIALYKNITGAVSTSYTRDRIDSQLKTELLSSLQPTFARISEMGVRYSSILSHIKDIQKILKEELSETWTAQYGIEMVVFGINGIRALPEDEEKIQRLQMAAATSNPNIAFGRMTEATATAMENAAKNENGAMMAFAGMNMAGAAGGSTMSSILQAQHNMAAQNQVPQGPAPGSWNCSCGQTGNVGKFCNSCGQPKPAPQGTWNCACGHAGNTGKFCAECGKPKPAPQGTWNCSCGHAGNTGKFCAECGQPKPAQKHFKCDKCGWEPKDPNNIPKFCPECGDPFNDDDLI